MKEQWETVKCHCHDALGDCLSAWHALEGSIQGLAYGVALALGHPVG